MVCDLKSGSLEGEFFSGKAREDFLAYRSARTHA
jgi:hypothetical protein